MAMSEGTKQGKGRTCREDVTSCNGYGATAGGEARDVMAVEG